VFLVISLSILPKYYSDLQWFIFKRGLPLTNLNNLERMKSINTGSDRVGALNTRITVK
jgi:hypothetical protein